MNIKSFNNSEQVWRAEKFVCSPSWQISESISAYVRQIEKDLTIQTQQGHINEKEYIVKNESKDRIYGCFFYGDQGKNRITVGIGKSSVFATIIYLMDHQDAKVKQHFKKLFPFFATEEKFIYIKGRSLRKYDQQQLIDIAEILIQREYVIVVDDIHVISQDQVATDYFLEPLQQNCKKLILVSSQRPLKGDVFKNSYSSNILVELPQIEAVPQISGIVFNSLGGQGIPACMREYFSYRLWFYAGGNFRNIAQNMKMRHMFLSTYYSNFKQKAIYDLLKSIKQELPSPQDSLQQKKELQKYFSDVLEFICSSEQHNLWTVMDLKFGTPELLPIVKSQLMANTNLQSFIRSNTLVGRSFPVKFKQTGGENIKFFNKSGETIQQQKLQGFKLDKKFDETSQIIGFHSRRAQYAFGQYFLHMYEDYWLEQDSKARMKFRHYLERVEYKHLLDFEFYRIQKRVKLEQIRLLQYKQSRLKIVLNDSEKATLNSQRALKVKLDPVLRLIECENELSILYLEALHYYREKSMKYEGKATYSPDQSVFQSLSRGYDSFYSNYSSEIRRGLEARKIQIKKQSSVRRSSKHTGRILKS